MPGKRDKKKERGAGSKNDGGLASFLGVGGMPDFNEDDLEAELLALTGGATGKGNSSSSGKKGQQKMSMADIDKMVASAKSLGENDEEELDEDGSDIDDADLLAELEGMEDDDEPMEIATTSNKSTPLRQAPTSAPKPSPRSGSSDLQLVNDRLVAYNRAVEAAKAKGDSSKIRRYNRAITSMNEMVKELKAGKKVNMDDLPPEVFAPAPPPTGGEGGAKRTAAPQKQEVDDDLAELAEWAAPSSNQGPPAKRPSVDTGVIDDRLRMYQEALRSAESSNDISKVKRYKRAIDTITALLKEAKAGRTVNMDTLPPVVTTPTQSVTTPTAKPPSAVKATPTPPGNMIDLDDPEFDEFNLSEDDMAAMMANLSSNTPSAAPPPTQPAAPPTQSAPPPKPKPKPTPTPPKPKSQVEQRPPGLIDLDTPEFAEFDLSEEDMAILAAQMGAAAKSSQQTTPTAAPPPEKTTQSLPAQFSQPVGVSGGVTREQVKAVLVERKDQYMKAMKSAKAKGDATTQRKYGTVAVQFDRAIKSIEQGQPIDLSMTPPPPPGYTSRYKFDITSYKPTTPPSSATPGAVGGSPQSSVTSQASGEEESDPAIPVPKTPLEGLQQRLDKYKEGLKSAQEKGESSRARRLGRIIKQYEEAIKANKAGKPVNYEELPAPPGYPPIPVPKVQVRPAQSLPASVPSAALQQRVKVSVNDKQIQALKQRGAEFQRAAREAKSKGDKETALSYLRYYKGIEQMIGAAEGGMPIDMTQVPPSPYSDPSKATPSKGVISHLEKAKEGDDETFELIEQQLLEQKNICSENSSLYAKLGNLGAASQYKNMADGCQRDLLAIKGIRQQGLTPPKFSMEMRKFAIVHSNPGLSDKKIEVEIIRGITIPLPSGFSEEDLNIYVEIEFPWPQDSTQKAETDKVRCSSNPEFNFKHQFDIDRKQMRSLQRTFKRQPIKCVLYHNRMLRKDIFLGQALVSLETLETKCEVHVSEDLKDERGKKPSGGKLEVFVRLREPLSGCDQEEKEQKWLVFQESIAAEPTVSMLRPSASGHTPSPIKVEQTTSMDALKLEFSLVQSAVKAGKRDAATIQRGKAIQAKLQSIKQEFQRNPNYKRDYCNAIAREIKAEKVYEHQLTQAGKMGEVKIIQGRRRVMENELAKMQKQ